MDVRKMCTVPCTENDLKVIGKGAKELNDARLSAAGMSLPLYDRSDDCVPEYLKGNPYILTGYRACYTTRMCLQSLFTLHNETLNVWTHGVGFIIFLVFSLLFLAQKEFVHCVIYGIFGFSCLVCMACSTIYHLFSSHEDSMLASITQQLDYYGISALIVASFLPPLYIGFDCQPFFQAFYMTSICVFGILSFLVNTMPLLKDDRFHRVRVGIYIAMVMSGVVPALHHSLLVPYNTETSQRFLGIGLMFILYGIGVLFYCLRIPECWYPGEFDFFLSSHQIWHMFVLAAASVHFFTCIAIYQQWSMSQGAC